MVVTNILSLISCDLCNIIFPAGCSNSQEALLAAKFAYTVIQNMHCRHHIFCLDHH